MQRCFPGWHPHVWMGNPAWASMLIHVAVCIAVLWGTQVEDSGLFGREARPGTKQNADVYTVLLA